MLDGVRWIAYGRVAYEVMAFATLAILAHLIPPAEYGRVAIALVLQTLAISLTNEGFGNALVQRKDVRQEHLQTASLLSIGFGFAVFGATLVLAPLVTTPLYGAATTRLVELAATMFPIYSFIVVPEAILMRRMDMRTITVAETIGTVIGFVLSIVLAVLGLGGAAVVLGYVAGALITAVILVARVGMPRPRWNRTASREIAQYGVPTSFAGLAYIGVQNVDNVLVGARLGAGALGLYYRAFALGVSNQLKIGTILMRVAFPGLTLSDGREHMHRMRLRMTRLNATLIVPLLAMLAIGAPSLIPFLLGPRWTGTVVPTQILCFAGIVTCLTYCAYPFLLAAGRPRWLLFLNLFQFVLSGALIYAALPYGLRGVCVAAIVGRVITMVLTYGLMSRLEDLPLRSLWLDSAPALTCSACLAVAVLPLMQLLLHLGWPAIAVLPIIGGVGAAVYIGSLWLLFRDAFDDGMLVIARVIGRGSKPPTEPAPPVMAPELSPEAPLSAATALPKAPVPVSAAAD